MQCGGKANYFLRMHDYRRVYRGCRARTRVVSAVAGTVPAGRAPEHGAARLEQPLEGRPAAPPPRAPPQAHVRCHPSVSPPARRCSLPPSPTQSQQIKSDNSGFTGKCWPRVSLGSQLENLENQANLKHRKSFISSKLKISNQKQIIISN